MKWNYGKVVQMEIGLSQATKSICCSRSTCLLNEYKTNEIKLNETTEKLCRWKSALTRPQNLSVKVTNVGLWWAAIIFLQIWMSEVSFADIRRRVIGRRPGCPYTDATCLLSFCVEKLTRNSFPATLYTTAKTQTKYSWYIHHRQYVQEHWFLDKIRTNKKLDRQKGIRV